ncbi:site-specific integrase [Actibacterium pelagium]|uniref:Integrase n=1 Tax=Actibacterium pelagium TaxID=2029103 RepID=A0A917EHC5_9RHOB|nr:site-specific integrase [Actibacterium pelagium]GGE43672.1 integrase [Actibacterium pelagium]
MFKLTKRSVEALEIKEKDYFVWDTEIAGFGVRVFASGRKSYLVQYRAGGRSRRRSIGQHGVLTAEEARQEARKLLGEVAKGGNPAEERQRMLRAPTVSSLCDRFLEEYAAHHCKPSTRKGYEIVVRTCIKPNLGSRKIVDVTRAEVVEFHHGLRDRPYMANRAVSILSKMFNLAEDWGLRTDGTNPARRIRKFREEEKKRYLSDEEQARLGKALAEALETGQESPYAVSAIYLLMLTGCRLGEILTLQWDFVTAHHLELPDSKTGRRRIPLPREVYDVIMSLPRREGNPYVILGETEDGHLVNLQKPWLRIRKAAGLEDVRMHDLRHTYASVAVMSGIDPFLLKEIMGHKNLQTTLRYAHFADEAVQRAAGSVASRLAGALKASPSGKPTLRVVGV